MKQKELWDPESARFINLPKPQLSRKPLHRRLRSLWYWTLKGLKNAIPLHLVILSIYILLSIIVSAVTYDCAIKEAHEDDCNKWCRINIAQFTHQSEYIACFTNCDSLKKEKE